MQAAIEVTTITQTLNFIAFQILWFGCVVGGGAHRELWIGSLSLIPLVLLVLFQPSRWLDFMLAFTATALGLSLEYIWIKLGILSFSGATFPPVWMGFLWFGFALTINHSMKFFRDSPIIGPLIVGFFGPITYLAGNKLGAVIVMDYFLLVLIIPTWIFLFHFLRTLSLKVDKQQSIHRKQTNHFRD